MSVLTPGRQAFRFPGEVPVPISAAVRWNDLVFVSGQVAFDMAAGKPLGSTIEEQSEVVLEMITAILETAGSRLDLVLKIEAFLADAADFEGWNRVFARHFPDAPPARSTLVAGFAIPGVLIEVQAIAGAIATPPSDAAPPLRRS